MSLNSGSLIRSPAAEFGRAQRLVKGVVFSL
jgi:hypothetical protein